MTRSQEVTSGSERSPEPGGLTVTLGDFLQARRAAVAPAQVGLPGSGRRRVPGLRREEVAALVGLSTDYYIRLEQGRAGRPSEPVLDSIADALLLDGVQREHLNHLANPRRARDHPPMSRARMAPRTQLFLETLTFPALVMAYGTQVIGWNDLACALFVDFAALPVHERNTARLLFCHEETAARHRDWEGSARSTVGILRMAVGENPDHPDLSALVDELAARSETFHRMWSEHHVQQKSNGTQLVRHPEVGDIDLSYVTWTTPTSPNHMLVSYIPEPDSPSAHAVDRLRSTSGPGKGKATGAPSLPAPAGHPGRPRGTRR